MSATTTFTFTDIATQSSTPTSSSGGGGSNINNRGASYFFGFLITFIALLLLFVGCGVGTRRRYRRQRLLFEAWGAMESMVVDQKEPKFWEPQLRQLQEASWASILPLSASITSNKETTKSSPSRPFFPIPLPSRNPQAINGLSLPSWSPQQPRQRKVVQDEEHLSLQVTVMIAMPKAKQEKTDDERQDEYQFGVFRVPWDRGEVHS